MKNDRNSNHKTTYARKLKESENYIDHVMDVNQFENIRVARHEFGLIGGPIINNSHSNTIDIESKLKGLDNHNINNSDIQYLDKFQMIEYEGIVIKE